MVQTLAGLENMTGTKLYVSNAEPDTPMALADFEDLTWAEIVGFVSMGAWGDTQADVSEPLMSEGRNFHTMGIKDGGSVEIAIQHRTTDAGYAVLVTNDGSNNSISLKKLYASGDAEYAVGVVSAPKQRQVSNDAVRGATVTAMINTKVLSATAAQIAALP